MLGSSTPRTSLVQQIAILVVLALALVTLFLVLRSQKSYPSTPKVTFRVEADGGFALVSYTGTDLKMSEAKIMNTPWQVSGQYKRGDTVYLTVSNPSQYGSVSCKIWIEGQLWKTSSATFPADQVACAGIIP